MLARYTGPDGQKDGLNKNELYEIEISYIGDRFCKVRIKSKKPGIIIKWIGSIEYMSKLDFQSEWSFITPDFDKEKNGK